MVTQNLGDLNLVDPAPPEPIQYNYSIASWIDGGNQRVSVAIELASGTKSDDIMVQLEDDGQTLVFAEKCPRLLLSTLFIQEQSNIDDAHEKTVSTDTEVRERRIPLDTGNVDEIWDRMTIPLPFSCVFSQYDPNNLDIGHSDYYQHSHTDKSMRKKKQKVLILHVELKSVHLIDTNTVGQVAETRGA